MIYMNEYEIEQAVLDHWHDPILGPAVQTLKNLVEWTNRNSDGWAYWPKPCRAAEKLQRLVQSQRRFASNPDVVTAADVNATYRPIKAFRTRQGADFEIVEAV